MTIQGNRLITLEEFSRGLMQVMEDAAKKIPEKERPEFYKAVCMALFHASSSIGLDGKPYDERDL